MIPHGGNIPEGFKMNSNPIIKLGWIPPRKRTLEQLDAHEAALASMPKFAMPTKHGDIPVGQKILLPDTWKHPGIVKQMVAIMPELTGGYPGVIQETGCCVGVGWCNMAATLCFTDILLRGDPEKAIIPLWLMDYGISRYLCGDRGEGEGSLGSTIAQAAIKYGTVDATEDFCPKFTIKQGMLCWGQAIEMQWSNGVPILANSSLLAEAKTHLIQTATQLHSAQEVWDSIANGYPVTRAFSYFCNPGSDVITTGDNPVCLGKYDGYGGHQESWLGIYNHPTLGKLFWEQNTWGATDSVYKADPAGGPRGGVWQKWADVDKMCRSNDAEIFSYSGFNGYPARNVMSVLKAA